MNNKSNTDTAIKISNVSKTFKLPHEKQKSLKGLFLNSFRRKSYEVQKALTDISFEVRKGDFFGILGRNGSGKSTLLKCIAGVYNPNSGHIKINGSLVPFIELGVGFNPELSGRDNVFLNGALLGFSRKQMEGMYDDIVGFAELEEFMDQKLNNYSSGMQVRLAFSIAIRARGDILVLDEVLAVGDSNFQKKCIEVFHNLKKQGKTIVLVTHDTTQVERFCNRAVVIEKGEIMHIGQPTKAIALYEELNLGQGLSQATSRQLKIAESKEAQPLPNYKPVSIDITAKDQELIIEMPFNLERALPENTVAALTLEDENAHTIYAYTNEQDNLKLNLSQPGKKLMRFTVTNVFPEGIYYADGAITSKDRAITYLRLENMATVKCKGLFKKEWLIRAPTTLKLN